MPNNDDLINDILKELDSKKNTDAAAPAEQDGSEPTVYQPDDYGNEPTSYQPDDYGSEPTSYQTDDYGSEPTSYQPDDYGSEPTSYQPDDYGSKPTSYQPDDYGSEPTSYQPDEYAEDQAAPDNGFAGSVPDGIAPDQDMYYQPYMDQYPPQRGPEPRKKKKKKKKRSRLPGVLILTTLIFAVSIILSMVIIIFGKDMLGIGKSDTLKMIIVKEGATTSEIAQQLKDEDIIKFPKLFIQFSKLRKADALYIPGEHFIRPNMAYETIIQNLTTDEIENKEEVEVVFKEGINIYEAADILESKGVCSAEDFIFNFNSGGFGFEFEDMLPLDSSLKLNRMEGYLFPDTYFFYKDMDAVQVCQRIYYNFNQKMTKSRYAKMKQLGLSLDELITLASIVQKEASSPDVMRNVASVFWNRINNKDKFPKLESDPTSNYSNDVVKPHLEIYNKAMIEAYDTYISPGLPPGAICNPGIDAIDAVLDPTETNYYYFVANIYTGETQFSETLEEHNEKDAKIKEAEEQYEREMEQAQEENDNE